MNKLIYKSAMGKIGGIEFPVVLWITLTLAAIFAQLFNDDLQNYYIYKGVFWHTVNQTNLYATYPLEHHDVNHYGPFFSVVMCPFAVLPNLPGIICWCMLNSLILLVAIRRLPISNENKMLVLLITSVEMMTSTHSLQINPMLTAWFIFAFLLTEKGNDFWATFFLAAGLMVKIYGAVGLIFFFFSKHRAQFILSFLFWVIVMFVLPMTFSSPSFIFQSYQDWWNALVIKDAQNQHSLMQNISLMGFINRSFAFTQIPNLVIQIIAGLMILVPLFRVEQYQSVKFRFSYLAIVLLSVVLLSSSAESPTYVLAVTGCAIWYVMNEKSTFNTGLLIFLVILTCLSYTDLFPAYLYTHFVKPYSLKALPCILIWLVLLRNVAFGKFVNPQPASLTYEERQHYRAYLQ